jgi:hypothetical protein
LGRCDWLPFTLPWRAFRTELSNGRCWPSPQLLPFVLLHSWQRKIDGSGRSEWPACLTSHFSTATAILNATTAAPLQQPEAIRSFPQIRLAQRGVDRLYGTTGTSTAAIKPVRVGSLLTRGYAGQRDGTPPRYHTCIPQADHPRVGRRRNRASGTEGAGRAAVRWNAHHYHARPGHA